MRFLPHAALEPRSTHRVDGIVLAAASSSLLWGFIAAAVWGTVQLVG